MSNIQALVFVAAARRHVALVLLVPFPASLPSGST
jgi:hypothetical protein